ncbi:MAG: hypothetical protein V1915_00645 [Candidatus Bathyarchaeota archaeon]
MRKANIPDKNEKIQPIVPKIKGLLPSGCAFGGIVGDVKINDCVGGVGFRLVPQDGQKKASEDIFFPHLGQ